MASNNTRVKKKSLPKTLSQKTQQMTYVFEESVQLLQLFSVFVAAAAAV